jgi:hypothetical protein
MGLSSLHGGLFVLGKELPVEQNYQPQTEKVIEKQIGSTTYEVHVQFNENSKENLHDKILRLIKNQISTKQ